MPGTLPHGMSYCRKLFLVMFDKDRFSGLLCSSSNQGKLTSLYHKVNQVGATTVPPDYFANLAVQTSSDLNACQSIDVKQAIGAVICVGHPDHLGLRLMNSEIVHTDPQSNLNLVEWISQSCYRIENAFALVRYLGIDTSFDGIQLLYPLSEFYGRQIILA